jgi:hypothetical protein
MIRNSRWENHASVSPSFLDSLGSRGRLPRYEEPGPGRKEVRWERHSPPDRLRMLPRNGGRALLLFCSYCNTPRRYVYGWEWDSFSGWSNRLRSISWRCRSCARLRYTSEGGYSDWSWTAWATWHHASRLRKPAAPGVVASLRLYFHR